MAIQELLKIAGCQASLDDNTGAQTTQSRKAMYLLPYLVLNARCHSTAEAWLGITEEILSVINVAAAENSEATVNGVMGWQSEVCIQAVFTLLDNIGQWVDDVTLAEDSFRCKACARALLYYETYVLEKSGSFNPAAQISGIFEDEDVSILMEIYSSLNEPDGLSGLAHLRKSLSLDNQLLLNKKAGNWAEILTSCEQSLHLEPTSIQRHSDVLNCLLNMCQLQAMVTHVDGLISRVPKYKKTWCMQGEQAAWWLGRWDLMDEYISGADEEGLHCSSFETLLAPLAAAGMASYIRAYPFVVMLHMLSELEDFRRLLVNDSFLEKSFHLDDRRFKKPSLWTREPLLAFRRLVFSASDLDAHVGNCWLQYAKFCHSSGHSEIANRAILEAQSSGAAKAHMQKAKVLWNTRRSGGAIAELQRVLLKFPKEDVIRLYTKVRELQPRWEKGYFYMAKYYNELLVDARIWQEDVLLLYAKGLRWGHRNLYQAVPRLLTLWFDFGSKYYREGLSSNKQIKLVHLGVMRGCLKDLPRYQWLAVLPQLVPRICHQNEETVQIVKDIITSVLEDFPQQAFMDNGRSFKVSCSCKALCFHPGQPKARTINISTEFSSLKRMMPLGIVMPIQPALSVSLPMYENEMNTDPHNIDMFSASDLSTISGIGDAAEILSSLQKPKKPKDDLRKDARMHDGVCVSDQPSLAKYPESRRRKLYNRTFAVIPPDRGLWYHRVGFHTRGLRHILQDIHTAHGKFDRQKTNPVIKRIYDQCVKARSQRPTAWFKARVAHAHNAAVWSMVGPWRQAWGEYPI
ncbi:hypothetical protein C5167_012740 [Papaver somniferum]|uniref:FAT domain-containing protein n=1 Tax=Papaver somniferum TaxID=3469 RepID=A0A4Y7IYB2_PAPSO|nr:hypothetical protein C5167_012740 [Papaver somniferum]